MSGASKPLSMGTLSPLTTSVMVCGSSRADARIQDARIQAVFLGLLLAGRSVNRGGSGSFAAISRRAAAVSCAASSVAAASSRAVSAPVFAFLDRFALHQAKAAPAIGQGGADGAHRVRPAIPRGGRAVSRELYLDRDDIDLVAAALHKLADGYRATAARPAPAGGPPVFGQGGRRRAARQAGRCVNLAQRLGRFPSALVDEGPRA